MKKFLVAVLSLLLVLSVSMVASAETNMSFYLDLLASGTITGESGGSTSSAPLSGVIVGGDFAFDKIVAGLEYDSLSSTKSDTMSAGTETMLDLKGGYRFLASDQFTLDAIASYLSATNQDSSTSDEMGLTGFLIGAQGAFNISEKISVSGALQFSVSASATMNGTEITDANPSITLFNLKGAYNILDNLGITLGYRSMIETMTIVTASTATLSGVTLGAVYTMK
jgi:hypothetical protein